MLLIKFLCALLVLVVTILAGLYPFLKRRKLAQGLDFPIGEALACGVFLGAGLIHMLGDAMGDFAQAGYRYPFALLLAGTTFLVLLLLEHIGRDVYQHQSERSSVFAIIAFLMLSIHSFLAGSALGLTNTLSMTMVIFLAIIAHKWAASFSLAVQLTKSQMRPRVALLFFLVFALMTPAGILFGSAITTYTTRFTLIEPILMSLAAGTFLYLGTLHGLKRAVMVESCCDLKRFFWVILGFAIMAVLALWV